MNSFIFSMLNQVRSNQIEKHQISRDEKLLQSCRGLMKRENRFSASTCQTSHLLDCASGSHLLHLHTLDMTLGHPSPLKISHLGESSHVCTFNNRMRNNLKKAGDWTASFLQSIPFFFFGKNLQSILDTICVRIF